MSSSARIDELRRKFDENPRRYFAPLANEYRKAGDFDQAIFICQEYLPQQPGHMSGHIVFGQALFEAKRLPEARTVFETALSLDPENLIALRHLADISHALGETVAARAWYERVLQADPRNEEIAAIMSTLGGTGTTAERPAQPPAAPITPTEEAPNVAGNAPSPTSVSPTAPTAEISAAAIQELLRARQATIAPEPAEHALTLDETPTVEFEASQTPSAVDGLEATSQAQPIEMPAIEALGLETTAHVPAPELLSLEGLGLETNAAPGQGAEVAASTPAPIEGLDTLSLDLTLPDAASIGPPPAGQTVSAAAPVADVADFGSFSFGPPATATNAAPAAPNVPIGGGHEATELMDFDMPPALELPPQSPPANVPAQIVDAIAEAVPAVVDVVQTAVPSVVDVVQIAVPGVADVVDATVPKVVDAVLTVPALILDATRADAPATPPPALSGEPSEVPPERAAPAFVTETMAQLYLSQGHRAAAIDIYRQLLDARPGDAELRARFQAIEQGGGAKPANTAAGGPPVFAGSGPSIRSVLRELFGIDAQAGRGNGSVGERASSSESGSIDVLFGQESVAEALSPLAVAFDGGYVATSGNLDELFAGGDR